MTPGGSVLLVDLGLLLFPLGLGDHDLELGELRWRLTDMRAREGRMGGKKEGVEEKGSHGETQGGRPNRATCSDLQKDQHP